VKQKTESGYSRKTVRKKGVDSLKVPRTLKEGEKETRFKKEELRKKQSGTKSYGLKQENWPGGKKGMGREGEDLTRKKKKKSPPSRSLGKEKNEGKRITSKRGKKNKEKGRGHRKTGLHLEKLSVRGNDRGET